MATATEPRIVEERRLAGEVPLWVHPEWSERFPWLVQGTTGRGEGEAPFDLGLAGVQPVGAALDRWRALLAATEMETVAHARQVHGADLWVHHERGAPGVLVMDGFDGHVTDRPGLLLSVGVADCVPVSVVSAEHRAVALLHAGWRGTAAGIVERGIHRVMESWQAAPAAVWVHCGPAICGACYEVGPEVHAGVHPDRDPPSAPTPIDLRAGIFERALALGVPAAQITLSAHCTRCGPPDFFSHRGGSKARQMGVLGVRDNPPLL
ncbi:MAG TPA: polyphenol oxidase family protein [Longimicrobium sp.]|nr:polyphenol oxidase family protein [Longimicrobium sp.]